MLDINYWWVNHKKTHSAEISGGYIWAPKQEKNGARSQFYTNLTLTEPGDLIFSYANAKIMAIGIITGNCSELDKPLEFGIKGEGWDELGWIVPIEWRKLSKPFSPKMYIADIAPLLPSIYSPITKEGNGNQKCYLAKVSKDLAELLCSISYRENSILKDLIYDLKNDISDEYEVRKLLKADISLTEKDQLTKARLGQGLYKQKLNQIEKKCRLTGISDQRYLVASHIKPWRVCNNEERLDGNNGLLLSPHIDRLFDRGWISFQDNGQLIVSNDATGKIMEAWGLCQKINVGDFSIYQMQYLAYHRDKILKKDN